MKTFSTVEKEKIQTLWDFFHWVQKLPRVDGETKVEAIHLIDPNPHIRAYAKRKLSKEIYYE